MVAWVTPVTASPEARAQPMEETTVLEGTEQRKVTVLPSLTGKGLGSLGVMVTSRGDGCTREERKKSSAYYYLFKVGPPVTPHEISNQMHKIVFLLLTVSLPDVELVPNVFWAEQI